MIRVLFDLPDTAAAAALVDVLLAAAEEPQHAAAPWRRLADEIGDGLDVLDGLAGRRGAAR